MGTFVSCPATKKNASVDAFLLFILCFRNPGRTDGLHFQRLCRSKGRIFPADFVPVYMNIDSAVPAYIAVESAAPPDSFFSCSSIKKSLKQHMLQ